MGANSKLGNVRLSKKGFVNHPKQGNTQRDKTHYKPASIIGKTV
jgi:hypothetical protein